MIHLMPDGTNAKHRALFERKEALALMETFLRDSSGSEVAQFLEWQKTGAVTRVVQCPEWQLKPGKVTSRTATAPRYSGWSELTSAPPLPIFPLVGGIGGRWW